MTGARFLAVFAAGLMAGTFSIDAVDSMPRLSQRVESSVPEPGGTAAAKDAASADPDRYAWVLFAYLTRQAKANVAGVADTAKRPFHEDDDTDGVWESWALASSSSADALNKSEVFHADGSRPVCWESLIRHSKSSKTLSRGLTVSAALGSEQGETHVKFPPQISNDNNQEVRMNRDSFETIISRGLYSKEGVEKAVVAAQESGRDSFINFPPGSKEVKAAWIRLADCDNNMECADRKRYHWRTVWTDTGPEVWGLAALHIMTRDLTNWFWADFTHTDCNQKIGACKLYAVGYSRDVSDTTPDGSEPKIERRGTRWENYVLRGTQTSFLRKNKPVTLSNPVLEATPQRTSCMTCHANAAAGWSQAVADSTDRPDAALPNPDRLFQAGVPPVTASYVPAGVRRPHRNINKQVFVQSSFEWSIIQRAKHEVANPAAVGCNDEARIAWK